ncbi:MAG: 3'-5' exonuclease [Clostridiales bacterium]|nr:3'-5' exonuclease [Clostridiales bacterium]
MILFFDTETTGLYPGEICQLTYIMQRKEEVTKKNFFFLVNEMPKVAEAIHGFSLERLKTLSDGKDFSFHFEEIKKDFESADLIVSHNFNFDHSFLRESYARLGETFTFKESFCTMKAFVPICKLTRNSSKGYKYPKLTELCEFLGVFEEEINLKTFELFNENLLSHDARYDTVSLYLAVNKAFNSGYLEEIAKFL